MFRFHLARPHQLLLLLIALTLVRGLIYAAVIPPWWQAHDEDFHFSQVKHLVDERYQPDGQDKSWLLEMTATFTAFPTSRWTPAPDRMQNPSDISGRYKKFIRPSFSYYFFAWPGQFLVNQDILFQLYAMRSISVLITCGIITFAFFIARQIFPDSVLNQVLVPWFILFNPSFMIVNSAINDGGLTVLLVTIIFYLLLRGINHSHAHQLQWPFPVALAVTILAFWSKITAFFLLPVWGILLLIYIWRASQKRWIWGIITATGLLLSLLLLPTYFQNKLLQVWKLGQAGISWIDITNVLSASVLWDTFANFWVVLGYFMYPLPQIWYRILLVVSMLAGLGLLVFGGQHIKQKRLLSSAEGKGVLLGLLFAGCGLAVLTGYTILRQNEYLRLARYIFPIILPFSVLAVTGWRALCPVAWKNHGLLLLAGGLFLFDTLVWLHYALPWYYPFWP
jgi:hypothetical protein